MACLPSTASESRWRRREAEVSWAATMRALPMK
jgi:hypothetical protein